MRQLTVEQVRLAVNTHLRYHSLPPPRRDEAFERELCQQFYYQTRNSRARKSHTKTRMKQYCRLGIDVDKITSCVAQPGKP
ncbi:MAG: hypothetical protein KatS3mg110_1768 [Pirellulaceae bacterium]|nr:MAG: hypothetical protein KatS3mg110_1768 [Pirellulaceae bacterium]